jgi:hypothetical protein
MRLRLDRRRAFARTPMRALTSAALASAPRACLAAALAATLACATPSAAPAPTVVTPDAPLELSGRFSEVDAVEVADALTRQLLGSHALPVWREAAGRPAIVALRPLRNRTPAHVNHRLITDAVERAIVAAGDARVRGAAPGPATSDGTLTDGLADDVDLTLGGTIVAQEESNAERAVVAYLVSMELVDRRTAKKLWVGTARTRKLVER